MSAAGRGTLEGVAAIRGFYEDWIGSYEEYRAGRASISRRHGAGHLRDAAHSFHFEPSAASNRRQDDAGPRDRFVTEFVVRVCVKHRKPPRGGDFCGSSDSRF
jgi:hypothetical protein